MTQIKNFQVDAFAERVFKGNPAAVCPLEKWLSDEQMQSIAMENNLAEKETDDTDNGLVEVETPVPSFKDSDEDEEYEEEEVKPKKKKKVVRRKKQ